jgi:choline dehydrogenase-like flavoprotein
VLLEGKRAVGIELKSGVALRRISARREVILSAGAVGSPMILLRSGIGPSSEIVKHGLQVRHELPGVGRNFHDHSAVSLTVSSPTRVSSAITLRKLPWIAWSLVRYGLTRRGFMAGNMIEGGGFTKSDPRLDRTDLQFGFSPGLRKPNGSFVNAGYGYTLAAMMLRPKSRGTVTLSGPKPEDGPLIDPNFFAETEDVEVMLKGVKLARRMLDAPSLAKYRGEELKPGSDVQTDDQLRQFIRDTAATVYHPAGTCKMGPGPDAVVDAQLRVHGIEGLRVVDASIMPVVVGGNTNAPTIMIAEKASDMILGKPPLSPANVAYGRR